MAITVRTFDGKEILAPMETIVQSHLMRNLLDERGLGSIDLSHESCTFEVLSVIFDMTTESEAKSMPDVSSEMALKSFQAAMYLDINAVLKRLSRFRGLLHSMSAKGCPDSVRAMIELKADINERNADFKTAIDVAKSAKEDGCLEELERARVIQLGYTPFQVQAYLGKTEAMLALINSVASVEDKMTCLNSREPSGQRTALHMACCNGHVGTARALLHAGADIHELADRGMTTLHLASSHGHADIVELLLDARASASVCLKNNGPTPLHLAVENGHTLAARALLTSRADVNAQMDTFPFYVYNWPEYCVTPLHLAASAGHAGTVSLLLDSSASSSAVKHGSLGVDLTPLHEAAKRGDAASARALLAAGADPGATADMRMADCAWCGRADVTPLHFVCSDMYLWTERQAGSDGPAGVVLALLAAGADAGAQAWPDWDGLRCTPVQCAAEMARAARFRNYSCKEALETLLAGPFAEEMRVMAGVSNHKIRPRPFKMLEGLLLLVYLYAKLTTFSNSSEDYEILKKAMVPNYHTSLGIANLIGVKKHSYLYVR